MACKEQSDDVNCKLICLRDVSVNAYSTVGKQAKLFRLIRRKSHYYSQVCCKESKRAFQHVSPLQPNYRDLSEVTCNNGQTKVATGHPWSHLMPAHPPTRHHWTMWTCQQYFFYQSLHFVHMSPIGTCTTGRLQTIHPRSSRRQTVAFKVQGPEDF